MDPVELAMALLFSGWPAAATAGAPEHGSNKGDDLSKPSSNVDVMGTMAGIVSISASAQSSDPGYPVAIQKITITGKGTDSVIARFVE